MIKNRLKIWKTVIGTLENPKDRPNDFQQLVLACLDNGMAVRDAHRIFSIGHSTIEEWREKYKDMHTPPDKIYFMKRARALGADDGAIAQWFGIERLDKVAMALAEK